MLKLFLSTYRAGLATCWLSLFVYNYTSKSSLSNFAFRDKEHHTEAEGPNKAHYILSGNGGVDEGRR